MASRPWDGGAAPNGGGPFGRLRLGTWNMSHWSAAKVAVVASTVMADVLAIQETHLAKMPLEVAHTTAQRAGLSLHHGRPARSVANSEHGKSCGVGFLCREGVAVAPALPSNPAWRRLHAMCRLAAVRLAPREGLPLGLLLVTIYGPLPNQPDRAPFDVALMEVVHCMDMQVPTVLAGDFNGALDPERDYLSQSGARRPVCPLLAQLLGPGGPWVDVHVAMLPPPLPWTFRNATTGGAAMASRIDLILANSAAMRLIRSASVQDEVRDGGHSPVLVTLALDTGYIMWRPPRPRLPDVLVTRSAVLTSSPAWSTLMEGWLASAQVQALKGREGETLDSLSEALRRALDHLVALAGGWVSRPSVRRLAYDSGPIRRCRALLADLHRLETWCSRLGSGVGTWPTALVSVIASLKRRGLVLPVDVSLTALGEAARVSAASCRRDLEGLLRACRQERTKRFRAVLPRLWKEDLGVIQRWLRGETMPWGTRPVLDSAGQQCMSVEAVDAAVQAFWVGSILQKHALVDEDAAWASFQGSRFGPYLPSGPDWPSVPWTADRVTSVLRSMREGAAPGVTGIPIAVWRSLPSPWPEAVARLLTLVEAEGRWPAEWVEAYVAMVPKASGGSRPQDQRPITVLEIIYRLWAKGVVLQWRSTVQHAFLSDAAFGFRSGRGTLHAAQLVADIIALSRVRGSELWLVSFDLAKCFDSLPWWAVFRLLRAAGAGEQTVQCFRAFYRSVRRRFRYGAVLGSPWRAANGLAQGCPASPDLLNILFESFHRWAAGQQLGIEFSGFRVPSVSFADDLTLAAASLGEIKLLAGAFLDWCALLGLSVTKLQAWSSLGPGHLVSVGAFSEMTTRSFRFVGVELGLPDRDAELAHWRPRLDKALATGRRLRGLSLPSSLCASLWRTTVLPQALYGCQVRHIRPALLGPLVAAGKAAVCSKPPLSLNTWTALEVALGWPLGESGPRHPVAHATVLQLHWLQELVNSSDIVGVLHRTLACPAGDWVEPSRALQSALQLLGWRIQRNPECARAAPWPCLAAEPCFRGDILATPDDSFPLEGAVFTDGSLMQSAGGAAVWLPECGVPVTRRVLAARSSTHCELVALALSMEQRPTQVLTDSLCALMLLRGWPTWSTARQLRCLDRVEVRQVLVAAANCPSPPLLEKVQAHNEEALRLGVPKAVGNDKADFWAKRAAREEGHATWNEPPGGPMFGPCGDPVLLLDASGGPVLNVDRAFWLAWWRRSRARWAASGPRARLDLIFPPDMTFDWPSSVGVFERAVVTPAGFQHPTQPAVIKWVARVRCGCLATRERLVRHHMGGVTSPSCLCCGAPSEDDAHVLAGCPATGSADWAPALLDAWSSAATAASVAAPAPPMAWLEAHRFPLLAALIPSSTLWHSPLHGSAGPRFLGQFHRALSCRLGEVLRRRGELMAAPPTLLRLDTIDAAGASPASPSPEMALPVAGLRRPCPLGPERRLSVADLRRVELDRRRADPSASPTPAQPPVAGELRRRWLRDRLVQVLQEDTVMCPAASGPTAVCLLALFEGVTGEPYTQLPGASVAQRVAGLGRALANLAALGVGGPLTPPLLRLSKSGTFLYNRSPRFPLDVTAWRRQQERLEAAHPASSSSSGARRDAGLAAWLRTHQHLRPVELEQGECAMALLILWEVDHGMPFPSLAGSSGAGLLTGFTRKLKAQVLADPELTAWLTCRAIQVPLSPGLPATHHMRWSVQIVGPAAGTPREWYDLFLARWKEYLESVAGGSTSTPRGAPRACPVGSPAVCKRRRVASEVSTEAVTDGVRRTRARSPEDGAEVHRAKRQVTLDVWRRPQPKASPAHGRASQAPPT